MRILRAAEAHAHPARDGDVLLLDGPLEEAAAAAALDAVERGAGLVALGGPLSFGRGGWARLPLARVLPALLHDGDDQVAVPGGARLLPRAADHPALRGVSFDPPPVLGRYHAVEAAEDARVLLDARHAEAAEPAPIVLVREHEGARVAVVAADLATHARRWDAAPRLVDRLCAWAARSLLET